MQLSADEVARYQRQMMIPGWGQEAQRALKESSVFVAGAGGLGSAVSIYLAVAGVGRLVVCDLDRVDLSNLNRQILHDASRIGVSKVASARATLTRLAPSATPHACPVATGTPTAARLVGPIIHRQWPARWLACLRC